MGFIIVYVVNQCYRFECRFISLQNGNDFPDMCYFCLIDRESQILAQMYFFCKKRRLYCQSQQKCISHICYFLVIHLVRTPLVRIGTPLFTFSNLIMPISRTPSIPVNHCSTPCFHSSSHCDLYICSHSESRMQPLTDLPLPKYPVMCYSKLKWTFKLI